MVYAGRLRNGGGYGLFTGCRFGMLNLMVLWPPRWSWRVGHFKGYGPDGVIKAGLIGVEWLWLTGSVKMWWYGY